MREFILDKAPGKDLIHVIIENKSFDDFYAFYKLRVDWYGYPLIHDRFVTYGLFDDLKNDFPENEECISKFIDFSINIAELETDKRFLNSIFLILNFCGIAKKITKPTAYQIEKVTSLINRVRKLSFFPNMSTFWEQILDYLTIGNLINKEEYLVNDDDYINIINLDFPSIDNNSLKSCPIPETKIMDEIDGIIGKYEPLKFVRSAKIDNDKYWVWVYKNISGNVWNWYITVKQDEENRINIERHRMHGGVNKTPEKLLLEYHYNS
jgi:hypothetical protein